MLLGQQRNVEWLEKEYESGMVGVMQNVSMCVEWYRRTLSLPQSFSRLLEHSQ